MQYNAKHIKSILVAVQHVKSDLLWRIVIGCVKTTCSKRQTSYKIHIRHKPANHKSQIRHKKVIYKETNLNSEVNVA